MANSENYAKLKSQKKCRKLKRKRATTIEVVSIRESNRRHCAACSCCLRHRSEFRNSKMYLMYYLNESGERVYTFSKVAPNGGPTMSAHPAKFSPEDKYSRERILIKKRFGILPTQMPPLKY